MEHNLELSHLVIEVPDPRSLDATLGGVVGLLPGDPTTDGARSWRNDDRAQRLVIEQGPANDATAVGFEASDEAAFTTLVARLETVGLPVVEQPELAARRRVERLVSAPAPWGTDLELVLNPERAPVPFDSGLVPSGFLTDGVGFGHVVLATTAFEESRKVLTEGLGFVQSDWLEMEIAEGIELEVRFFHCNARHHTVALAKAPFELPQTLHHIMFEVNDRDDVGTAFDRAWATDLPIPNGLGRHDNDGMFSFYLQTPAGFQIEVGHGARVITDDWDDDRVYGTISAWGHQPLRPA